MMVSSGRDLGIVEWCCPSPNPFAEMRCSTNHIDRLGPDLLSDFGCPSAAEDAASTSGNLSNMGPEPRPLRTLIHVLGHRAKRQKDLNKDKHTRHNVKGICHVHHGRE